MQPIRVVLVDNEEVFREGVAKLLNEQPHIKVVYQTGSGKEAIVKSEKIRPEVILISSQISEGNTLEAVKEIVKSVPAVKVAMISRSGAGDAPLEMLKAGARACLAKSISGVDLVKSIELISSGRIIVSPVFAEKLLDEISSRKPDESAAVAKAESGLSERELEITELIAEGATNREIAKRLVIAESTVKVHVKNILSKLELRNRQQLAVYAVLQNWVAANIKAERKD